MQVLCCTDFTIVLTGKRLRKLRSLKIPVSPWSPATR